MQMRHRFTTIPAVIDHQSESALVQPLFLGDGLCNEDQMSQQRLVLGFRYAHARDFLFRDDQNVDRRLRIHVVKGEASIILKSDPGRDFAGNDL